MITKTIMAIAVPWMLILCRPVEDEITVITTLVMIMTVAMAR